MRIGLAAGAFPLLNAKSKSQFRLSEGQALFALGAAGLRGMATIHSPDVMMGSAHSSCHSGLPLRCAAWSASAISP